MSTLINSLSEFCMASITNRILLLYICWAIWPGSMFAFGIIFESRLVPIDKRQSVLFCPGDLLLAPMFVLLLMIHKEGGRPSWGNSNLWWIFTIICMFICALALRLSERKYYRRRAHNSPTKILHDIVGYFFIPVMLLGIGIPELVGFATKPSNYGLWLGLAGCLFIFVLCMYVDGKKGFTSADVEARHPAGWQPIWKTGKIRKS